VKGRHEQRADQRRRNAGKCKQDEIYPGEFPGMAVRTAQSD
jgi:hypothetical protein